MGLDGELDRYQFEQFLQVAGQALSNRKVDHLPENKCTINAHAFFPNKNPEAVKPRDPLPLKEKCSKGDSNTHRFLY